MTLEKQNPQLVQERGEDHLPKITIPLHMYDGMRDSIRNLELALHQARKDLDTKAMGSSEDVPLLLSTLRAAIPLIQFAVANNPPEMKSWPWMNMRRLAELLPTVPTATAQEIQLAKALKEFSEDVEEIAHKRELRAAQARKDQENAEAQKGYDSIQVEAIVQRMEKE